MRYLVGLMFVLAGLVALPQNASAQADEEGTTSEPNLQEPAPTSEPAPEEPALQLKLDDTGVGVVPSPPRTPDGYTLEEMDVRVRRARIGVGVSAVPIFFGTVVALGSAFSLYSEERTPEEEQRDQRATVVGTVVAACGVASMIATGVLLAARKRKRRELRQAHHGTPRRVQWDLARSRLVF